ncbi:MAG: ABC transporter ATP-binding protein [Spirochaetaceae bacterium]|nr:MAG: ABC transporter ATP-binding protein [Spirochaetaceae bacterium]
MADVLLSVRDLTVSLPGRAGSVDLVRSISFDLHSGTVHALVGESGAGKTLTARAVLGLLPRGCDARGRILFRGGDLLQLPESQLRAIRGRRIAMVFQQPDQHLNPSMRVGTQIEEVLRVHLLLDRDGARERTKELLALVELSERTVARAYPHELSGGMKQRVMIALAIACGPDILIADEPTTALDARVQAQIMKLLDRIRREVCTAVLFISHDLALVGRVADEVSVMYCGRIVEHASAQALFECAHHPYTQRLIASTPDPAKRGRPLAAIPGTVPDADQVPDGCAFAPRCPLATDRCRVEVPALRPTEADRSAACHFAEAVMEGCLLDR